MRKLPYLPEGREILYVSADNKFIKAAEQYAFKHSLDPAHRTGAVIVDGDEIIGYGANGSDFHNIHGCERKRQNIPTGKGYNLCEGCSPVNHAEQKAIADVVLKGLSCEGKGLYLYGHWWCCESCWDAMIKAGIQNIYLPEQ